MTIETKYNIGDEVWVIFENRAQCLSIEGVMIPKSAELGDKRSIPAWSLHRLLELCGIDRMPINFYKRGKVRIKVNHIHPTHDGRSGYNHYDSLIDCIEWLIKEGYFNKEYLEE